MAENTAFITELTQALARQKVYLDKTMLPEALRLYTIQGTATKAIRTTLLTKGLIHDDPYKYDNKMTEIELPQTTSYTDNEKAMVIGSRLAHYQTMLEFLNNYYQFNTDFLIPKRISKLIALNKTFLWNDFSTSSTNLNTRGLADILQSVYISSDTLAASLLRDSVNHLSKSATSIAFALKALSLFHRERYKLFVREKGLEGVEGTSADVLTPNKILSKIKKNLNAKGKGSYYEELVLEVIREDFSENASQLQKEALNHLQMRIGEKKVAQEERDMRSLLISGIKSVGFTANHFGVALGKILFNQALLDKTNNGFITRLRSAFRQVLHLKEKDVAISIIIKDDINQMQKKEVIMLNEFEQMVNKKIRLFKGFMSENTIVFKKLSTMDDDTLYKTLSKYITEANTLMQQFTGLDDYYKTVNKEMRSRVKGIKIELTTLHNLIIKANRLRAEYASFIEEKAQMKKLGIVHD